MDEREIENFREEIEKTTDQIEGFRRAIRVLGPNLLKLADPTGKLSEEFVKATQTTKNKVRADLESVKATDKQTQATSDNIYVTEALTEAQEELEESSKKLKGAIGSVVEGAVDVTAKMADAALNTEQSFNKYGSAIGALGDAAQDLGKQFGIFGTILGSVVKIFTSVAETQLKFIDDTLKASDSLSGFGANANLTGDQLLKLGYNVGLSAEQLPGFIKNVKNVGEGLRVLGSDTAIATQRIFELTSVTENQRRQFRNLGISQDELIQSQLDYINLQKLSGRTFSEQYITSGQLKKSSLDYVLNLQELSRITGKDIEASKRDLEIANNTAQMAVYSFQQSRKRTELEQQLAQASNADRRDEAAAIRRQIDALDKQQDAIAEANKAMAGLGMPEAAGAMQQILTQGSYSSEAAQRFLNLGMDLEKYRKQFQEGTFDAVAFQNEYQQKFGQRFDNLSRTLGNSGEAIEQMIRDLGLGSKEQIAFMSRVQEQLGKGIPIGTAFEKAREDIETGMKTGDRQEKARNDQLEAEIKARIALNKQLQENLGPALKAIPKMAEAMEKLTASLTALATIAATVGAVALGGILIKGVKDLATVIAQVIRFSRGAPGPLPPGGAGGPGGVPGGSGTRPSPTIEKRTDRLGRDYYIDTSSGKRVTRSEGEAALGTSTTPASPTTSPQTTGQTAPSTARKVLTNVGKQVGIGGAAGLAGVGLSTAGESFGGTTGQVLQGAGTVATFAGTGFAVGGLYGALAGGVIGLGKAVWDFSKSTKDNTEAISHSDKVSELLAKQEETRQQNTANALERYQEQQDKLTGILNGNNDALSKVTDGLENLSDQQFKDLIANLQTQNGLTSDQITELKALRTESQEQKQLQNEGTGDNLRRKEEDEKLADLNKQLKTLEEIYKKAQEEYRKVGNWTPRGKGIKEGMDEISPEIKALKDEIEKMTDARKEEDEALETAKRKLGWLDYFSRQAGYESYGQSRATEIKTGENIPPSDTAGKGGTADEQDLLAQGLKLKPTVNRDVQAPDAKLNPKLIDLAKRIQTEIPGFNYFSGFNDRYHQRNKPGSKHTEGKALDFTLDSAPSKQQGQAIVAALKEMGFHYAQDEYNNASAMATGGHIHAQIQAEKGGIASGPKSGYPATLHGNEMIVPLNPNSILSELGKKSVEQAYNDIKTKTESKIITTNDNMQEILRTNRLLIEVLSNKLDSVVSKLETSNDTQTKILRYSQA